MKEYSLFTEMNSDGEKIIKVGGWCGRNDGSKFFCSILEIHPDKKNVRTDCGDSYYDFDISFDTILTIAKKIKELQEKE